MPKDPLVGRQLANFRVERLIKRGGMARVYYGWDVKLERPVAIKVIDFGYQDDPTYAERFVREARAVASWRHENVVQVYYADDQDGLYYFCMEYVDGMDLGEVLAQYGRAEELMPHEDVLRVGRAVARALDYAHGQGVIHRDVKPSNVMVSRDERVVLTDFGLALDVHRGSIGHVFGSAHYIAPEQAQSSANAVPQSDLYSLGVILYQALTGAVPFDDPSPTSVALQHLTMSPPSPRQINPNLSQETEAVLLKALSKQPEDRYQTGAELMDALEKALCAGPLTSGIEAGTTVPSPAALDEAICPEPVGVSNVSVAETVALHLQGQIETTGQEGIASRADWPREEGAGLQLPAVDSPTPIGTMTVASAQTGAPARGQALRGNNVRWVLYAVLGLVVLGIVVALSAVGLYVTNDNVRALAGRVLSPDLTRAAPGPMLTKSPLESPASGITLVSPVTATVGVALTGTQTAAPAPTHLAASTPTPEPTPAEVLASQLRLSMSAAPAVAKRHTELTYTIRVVSGGGPVQGVVITSAIPANTEYVAGSATEGGAQERDVVRWSVSEMAADQEHEFAFRVVVLSGERVVNERYGARCDKCVPASGPAVVIVVEAGGVEIYLPLVFRSAD